MSAEDEEDARLEALADEANWCRECDCPIGCGKCDGCIAVASLGDDGCR